MPVEPKRTAEALRIDDGARARGWAYNLPAAHLSERVGERKSGGVGRGGAAIGLLATAAALAMPGTGAAEPGARLGSAAVGTAAKHSRAPESKKGRPYVAAVSMSEDQLDCVRRSWVAFQYGALHQRCNRFRCSGVPTATADDIHR
jgi:hypothetical protein